MSVYTRSEDDGPVGDTGLEKPTMEIQYTIRPGLAIAGRGDRRKTYNSVFPDYDTPALLTVRNNDFLFRAKPEWNVRREHPYGNWRSYVETEDWPFAVFNGLVMPESEADIHKVFEFVGMCENGPLAYDTQSTKLLATVKKAGQINIPNLTGRSWPVGTQLTWSIDYRPYIFQLGNLLGSTEPPIKKKTLDNGGSTAHPIRGYFIPATTDLFLYRYQHELKLAEKQKDAMVSPKDIRERVIELFEHSIIGITAVSIPSNGIGMVTLVPH